MTTFDDRERQEETRFKHEQELAFKARNRGNRLFGLWIAERLGLSGWTPRLGSVVRVDVVGVVLADGQHQPHIPFRDVVYAHVASACGDEELARVPR